MTNLAPRAKCDAVRPNLLVLDSANFGFVASAGHGEGPCEIEKAAKRHRIKPSRKDGTAVPYLPTPSCLTAYSLRFHSVIEKYNVTTADSCN